MYRRRTGGWLKHWDFILLDIISLQLGFILAYSYRMGRGLPYNDGDYRALALFFIMVEMAIFLFSNLLEDVVKRGVWREIKSCAASGILILLFSSLFMFSMKTGDTYSRIVVYLTCGIYVVLNLLVRLGWKSVLRHWGGERRKDAMLVAAYVGEMAGILETLQENSFNLPGICGLIVLDGEAGMEGFPYPVVASRRDMLDYITRNWVDELLVDMGDPSDWQKYRSLQLELDRIAGSGVAVHKIICQEQDVNGRAQLVESVGGFSVLTDSIRIVSMRQSIFKRCLDIAGGLVGTVLAGLVLLFVGPIIYAKSPGPVIFKQPRVGRNGKIFTMYKIRSMELNADAKKKDFVAANRVADGMMFKLDNDPRIIGSKLLPDGTYKKGVGNFIRDYSLDEFPQFVNVLKGDMSLVGTRPPTLDEWEKYEPHHRARMTFRPGITGLWQVSGRSDITDFDEAIKLDMRYINTWSTSQDLRIMWETVKKVVKKDGAR